MRCSTQDAEHHLLEDSVQREIDLTLTKQKIPLFSRTILIHIK